MLKATTFQRCFVGSRHIHAVMLTNQASISVRSVHKHAVWTFWSPLLAKEVALQVFCCAFQHQIKELTARLWPCFGDKNVDREFGWSSSRPARLFPGSTFLHACSVTKLQPGHNCRALGCLCHAALVLSLGRRLDGLDWLYDHQSHNLILHC